MLLHHEEKPKSSLYNLTKFTNPLVSNTEEGNDNFTFNESISQPTRLEVVEDTRREIGAHKMTSTRTWF